MKQLCLLFLGIFLLSISFSFAQKKFSYGVELGVNCAGIPYTEKQFDAEINEKSITKFSPYILPTGGFWGKYEWNKHFFVSFALQYARIGERYHSHSDRNDATTSIIATYDHWSEQKFQRVSLPISFGYQFLILKRKFDVSLGYKQNYFINGSHSEEYLDVRNGGKKLYRYTENPFEQKLSAKRWTLGAVASLGLHLTPKINLGLNYGINETMTYGTSWGSCATGAYTDYHSHDFFLMVKYAFR